MAECRLNPHPPPEGDMFMPTLPLNSTLEEERFHTQSEEITLK